MANKFISLGVALLLVVLLGLLTDPFMLWMPPVAAMSALLGAAVLAAAWAGFVMYEKPRDERELEHTMSAGRAAYLSGVGVLVLAVVVQGFTQHHVDPWISAALAAMVISKLVARFYSEQFK